MKGKVAGRLPGLSMSWKTHAVKARPDAPRADKREHEQSRAGEAVRTRGTGTRRRCRRRAGTGTLHELRERKVYNSAFKNTRGAGCCVIVI